MNSDEILAILQLICLGANTSVLLLPHIYAASSTVGTASIDGQHNTRWGLAQVKVYRRDVLVGTPGIALVVYPVLLSSARGSKAPR